MRAPLYSSQADELLEPDAIDAPQKIYARLRDQAPIARIGESGVHLVTTWALVDEALQREADFSANLTGVLFRGPDGEPATFELTGLGGVGVIATADEPHHSVHRSLAQPRMVADRINALEDRMRVWARQAISPMIEKGGGDFAPVSELIPALALADVLGLPEEDVSRFRVWAMMGGDMLAGEADHERLAFLGSETGKMAAYLGTHLDLAFKALGPPGRASADSAEDRGAPMLHALARGLLDEKISREEAVGIAIVMFGAGGESTAALIGSALLALAENPAIADELRSSPDRIPRYVEEIIRLEPPFNFHYRSVRRPCQLGGYDLDVGDRLMLVWASANRDPAIFDDPDALRLDRKFPKRHMSFGRGAHFCIGAPLARLEARVVIEELLSATRGLAPRPPTAAEPAPVQYAKSIFIRRLERLELQTEKR
jgi:cytochrome P450